MIVTLARTVQEQLKTLDHIERIENAVKDITDTQQALDQATQAVAELLRPYRTVADRLPSEPNEQVVATIASLVQDVERSHQNYATSRRQVQALNSVRTKSQTASTLVAKGWTQYASALVQPYFDLLVLVGSLPEMQGRRVTLDALRMQARQGTATVPTSPQALAAFDASVRQLGTELSAAQGLSDAVKLFLQRALLGRATVDDLTDEVLAWCRQDRHGSIFTISLAAKG